jgi:aspartate aminotransferase
VYDGLSVAGILPSYRNSVLVTSYSKDLSIPGERLGYIAVNPSAESSEELINALVFSNRTLGFVNAPALMQRVVRNLQGASVDIGQYEKKRDRLCAVMRSAGYRFVRPEGAFYLFPEAPGGDDIAFVNALQEEKILAVPGSGFGYPGNFRISYCVDDSVIEAAADGFAKAARRFG